MATRKHGRIKSEYVTGATAINYSTAGVISNCWYKLKEVRLNLSAAGGAVENLTIAVNSGLGSAYDTILITQAMASVQDYVYRPDGNGYHTLGPTDTIDIDYTNTNSRTYGLEVIYEVI